MYFTHQSFNVHLESFPAEISAIENAAQSTLSLERRHIFYTMNAWTCSICGKVNEVKNGTKRRDCITCGRQKGNNAESTWTCLICDKVHHENNGEMQSDCTTCGRKKGYAGCKASPEHHHMPVAKQETNMVETRDDRSFVANRSMFLSNKHDYEANARMSTIDEVNNVLASIDHTLQNN